MPDINECQSNPCKNRAECRDGVNKYTCMCKDGYEGNFCELLSTITKTNVPLKQTKLQFVFQIDVSSSDLSDAHVQANIADTVINCFL